MDRGAWQATVHGVTESRTRLKQYSRGNVRGRKMTGNEWDYKERFFSILLRLWPSEAWSYSFPFHPAYCPLAIKNLTLVLMLI